MRKMAKLSKHTPQRSLWFLLLGVLMVGGVLFIQLSNDQASNNSASNSVFDTTAPTPSVIQNLADGRVLRPAPGLSPTRTPIPIEDLPPGRQPMQLPEDFRETLVHYATVDRIDGMSRNLYISPNAVEALRAGEAFPERTLIVIEAFHAARDDDGELIYDDTGHYIQDRLDVEIHASEMRTTWRLEDMQTTSADGDWNFAAFDSLSEQRLSDVPLSDCFSCHESAHRQEFLFTIRALQRYINTEQVQYQFCPRSDRAIC